MQALSGLEIAQRAVRSEVCVGCSHRPEGSEAWPPTRERSCQGECTIFMHLPRLREIVMTTNDPTLGPYERAVTELVCQTCQASPTAGDFCEGRTTRDCPLSRYLGQVVDTLERLRDRGQLS